MIEVSQLDLLFEDLQHLGARLFLRGSSGIYSYHNQKTELRSGVASRVL